MVAGDGSGPCCPITGRAGQCPMAKEAKKAKAKASGPLAEGQERLRRGELVAALKAFTAALEQEPDSEAATLGKVAALRRLSRPRGALRCLLVALRRLPGCEALEAQRAELEQELGRDAEEVASEAAAELAKAGGGAEAPEAACPAAQARPKGEELLLRMERSRKLEEGKDFAWLATEESSAFRAARKAELVGFYRDFYRANSSVSTSTYTSGEKNGLSIKGGHRPMPRPEGVVLPPDHKKPLGCLKEEALASIQGRLLLSVHGDIFDVSDRPDKYGPEGPYREMAGRDITWALWAGLDEEEHYGLHYDLLKAAPREERDRRFQGLMSWWAFFEQEYGAPVGRLEPYEAEWLLPAPPKPPELCCLM